MEDIIIIKIVEESVKISELTEREKIIYNYGYERGWRKGIQMWPGIVAAIAMLIALIFCIF